MTGTPVVHIGENSPEHVAYRLLHDIVNVEGKILHWSKDRAEKMANRKYILDTYAECLHAAQGNRSTATGLRGYKTEST